MYEIRDNFYLSNIESPKDGHLDSFTRYEFVSDEMKYFLEIDFHLIGNTKLDTIAVVRFDYKVCDEDNTKLYNKIPTEVLQNCLKGSMVAYFKKTPPAIVVRKKAVDEDSENSILTRKIDSIFVAQNYIKGEVEMKDFGLVNAYVQNVENIDKAADIFRWHSPIPKY